jgi:hypothetical protein
MRQSPFLHIPRTKLTWAEHTGPDRAPSQSPPFDSSLRITLSASQRAAHPSGFDSSIHCWRSVDDIVAHRSDIFSADSTASRRSRSRPAVGSVWCNAHKISMERSRLTIAATWSPPAACASARPAIPLALHRWYSDSSGSLRAAF